jgi:hypothetical protein
MSLRRFSPRPPAAIALLLVVVPHIAAAEDTASVPDLTVTIRIEIGDRAELDVLTRLVSIENVRGHEVWAIATPRQLEDLRAAGWSWQGAPVMGRATEPGMCAEGWVDDGNRSWTCYPSYQQYEALMLKYATDHPDICQLVDLGPTANAVQPHRLWALIISDHPRDEEDEPEVLLTSTMHGDETTGYILTLRLVDHLIKGYGNESEITSLVDETELWINPLANPDGTYFGGDDTVADAIRYYATSDGADSKINPNRNFPDFEDGDHPDGNPWWPETEAMMALAEANTFVLSANFHGGAELVNYPWDTLERHHPDDLWFRFVARGWANLAQADSPGGYFIDQENGISNGWDWYEINGGRQDFMTFFHGGREVTIELSETKLLPPEDLDELWSWNRRAFLSFIAHSLRGIRGVVTDANGTPLAATIEVLGIDREEDGSTVRTDPDVGDYHRLLLPGLYDLRIEAPNFAFQEIHGVAVVDGQATIADVVLHRVIRRPTRRAAPNHAKKAPRLVLE